MCSTHVRFPRWEDRTEDSRGPPSLISTSIQTQSFQERHQKKEKKKHHKHGKKRHEARHEVREEVCYNGYPTWILQQDRCGNLREIDSGIYLAEPWALDRSQTIRTII